MLALQAILPSFFLFFTPGCSPRSTTGYAMYKLYVNPISFLLALLDHQRVLTLRTDSLTISSSDSSERIARLEIPLSLQNLLTERSLKPF